MSQFIYFTPEEKARAQNTDLVSLLRAQGERPVRSGREFRTPNDPSITVRATNGLITPRASAATPSASSSAITVSLIRRRFCFCWAERTEKHMNRQSL